MVCLPFTELNKKEDYQQNIFHGMILAPARIMPVDTHTYTYVFQWVSCGSGARNTAWRINCLRSSKPVDYENAFINVQGSSLEHIKKKLA
jgi:hypothetical protein